MTGCPPSRTSQTCHTCRRRGRNLFGGVPRFHFVSRLSQFISSRFLVGLTAAFNIGIPHKSNTEDVYNGYRIPRGSLIFANVACVLVYLVWRVVALSSNDYYRFMLNDPSVWPEPRSFKPERFLDTLAPGQFDPQAVIFGFGRRLVPHPIHSARVTTLNPT